MAAKLDAKSSSKPKKAKAKKSAADSKPEKVQLSNVGALRSALEPFREEYNQICDRREAAVGTATLDISDLMEKAGNDTGHSRTDIKAVLDLERRLAKEVTKRKNMDPQKRERREMIEAAVAGLKGSPLGDWAIGAG